MGLVSAGQIPEHECEVNYTINPSSIRKSAPNPICSRLLSEISLPKRRSLNARSDFSENQLSEIQMNAICAMLGESRPRL